jgi:quinol monooxygenase YgiN
MENFSLSRCRKEPVSENNSIFKQHYTQYIEQNLNFIIMIAITAILKSKPENTEQVLSMLTHLITETRKETACKRYDLHYHETDFVFWEEWENQEGLDLHNKAPHLLNFIDEIGDLVEGGIQIYKTFSVF